jgi:probable HAF family extracellular repeat protein
MMTSNTWLGSIAIACILACPAAAPAANFTVANYGAISAYPTDVVGVNSSGDIIANDLYNAPPSFINLQRAYLRSFDMWAPLGSLTGGSTTALGINDSARVVGTTNTADGSHAFVFKDGTMTDLGRMGGSASTATAINTAGLVVGFVRRDTDRAWLYNGEVTTDLGTLGGSTSRALAINDAGAVVGASTLASGNEHAFLYSRGTMKDLGTLGGSSASKATAINSRGQVAGESLVNVLPSGSTTHAFLYSNAAMADLGTLGGAYSSARAINAAGQVVGVSTTASGEQRAFLFSQGVMVDLNSLVDLASGWVITSVGGINDAGQIAALACNAGTCNVVLLTPVLSTVVEYQNTQDFPGSPGGHFFYTDSPSEQAILDSGADGRFARTGRNYRAGGTKRLCRFYGSVLPGPNSHFFTLSDDECNGLKALQRTPTPTTVQQWNYEGLVFAEIPANPTLPTPTCTPNTTPVWRAYNNAYTPTGGRNPWDSNHRYSSSHADILDMVNRFNWMDEGIVFCAYP